MAFVAIGGLVVAAGADAYAGSQAAGAASSAAQAQISAENKAAGIAQQANQSIQQNEAPYMQAGNAALQTLSAGFANGGQFSTPFTQANLQSSPGYQYQLQQGQQATTAAAAARGMSLSPATLMALNQNAQGLASTNYQQQFNDFMAQRQQTEQGLEGLVNTGQNATSQSNQGYTNMANQQTNAAVGAGNAQAAGIVGQANAWGNAAEQFGQQVLTASSMGASGGFGGAGATQGAAAGQQFADSGAQFTAAGNAMQSNLNNPANYQLPGTPSGSFIPSTTQPTG